MPVSKYGFLSLLRLGGMFLAVAAVSLAGYNLLTSQGRVLSLKGPTAALPSPTVLTSPKVSPHTGTATPTPKIKHPTVGLPRHLRIPAISVDTDLDMVGLTPSRAMENPPTWDRPAWYKLGWAPGEQGNAVIAGHLDSNCCPAVFWRLHELKPGMKIYILDSLGKQHVFSVTESTSYNVNNAPLQKIFGPSQSHNLNLITCDGIFDPLSGMHDQRLIVYSSEISG